MIERHIKGGQKSIPYKQLGLSMDIETKVVQHVSSPKESNLTTLNLGHSFKSHTVWYSVRPSTHTSRITKSHHLGREGREAPSTDTMLPCLFSVVPNSRDPAIVERLLLHSSGHVLTLFCWLAKFK